MIDIRLGEHQHIKALTEILRSASLANAGDRAFLEANPDVMSVDLGQLISGRIYFAEKNGNPVGYASILKPESGVAEIDGVFVKPTHWRNQIGTAIIDACIGRARTEGATQVHVVVNPHALAFYSALGFALSAHERPEVAGGLAFSMLRTI